MAQARRNGAILVLAGLGIALTAIFAHQLGLGPKPGFEWKKLLGTVVGVVLVVSGIIVF